MRRSIDMHTVPNTGLLQPQATIATQGPIEDRSLQPLLLERVECRLDDRLLSASTAAGESDKSLPSDMDVEAKPERPFVKSRREWTLLMGLMVCEFLRGFDDTIVNAITPILAADFDSLNQISWFGSAYYLPQAALSVLAGKLSSNVNLRVGWTLAVVFFIAGLSICAAAHTSTVFIIGRAISGIGTAMLLPFALAMLGFIANETERPIYLALILGAQAISGAIGPLIGAVFAELSDWRYAFIMNIPLVAISGIVVLIAFSYQPRPPTLKALWAIMRKEFDFVGCTLFIVSIVLFVLGLQFAATTDKWSALQVILTLAFGGIMMALFLVSQVVGDRDMKFFPASVTNRGVFMALFIGFFLVACDRTCSYYMPFYLQEVLGKTVIASAALSLPYLFSFGVGSITIGFVLTRFTHTNHINIFSLVGCILQVIGSGIMISFDEKTSTIEAVLVPLLEGFGAGCIVILALTVAQRHVPNDCDTLIQSLVISRQLLGSTLGITLGGTLLNQNLSRGLRRLSLDPADKQLLLANQDMWYTIRSKLSAEAAGKIDRVFARATKRPFEVGFCSALLGLLFVLHLKWRRYRVS